MKKPSISSFLNWSDTELDELSSVSPLDIAEALALSDAAEGEGAAMLRSKTDQSREIVNPGNQPSDVETGA